jgi:hypothetical protein
MIFTRRVSFYTQSVILHAECPKYRIVTVTIVTICDSVLWRLKTVTMRLVLKSFKNLVLASFFFTFFDDQLLFFKNRHNVTICDSLNAATMHTVIESFKSPSLAVFFVTLFIFKLHLAYSTDLLILGYCRTNNYQKHFCFWWSNITSLITQPNKKRLIFFPRAKFNQF